MTEKKDRITPLVVLLVFLLTFICMVLDTYINPYAERVFFSIHIALCSFIVLSLPFVILSQIVKMSTSNWIMISSLYHVFSFLLGYCLEFFFMYDNISFQ